MIVDCDSDNRAGLPSASSAEKLLNCPGSAQAEQGKPQSSADRDNEAATQGTRIHLALELDDPEQLDISERPIFQRLRNFGIQILNEWLDQNHLLRSECNAGREERFWIRNRANKKPIASAKLDRCYVCSEHGLALDFKTGFLDAAPSYVNAQLRLQALALWHEYPQLTKIRVAIAQVRFKGKTDYCDYLVSELREAETELLHALWRSIQAGAPRYPGSWCRYCRANGDCREAAAFSLLPIVHNQENSSVPDLIASLTPIDLARIHERKAVAETIFKAVDARLKEMSPDQLAELGLELKPNSPTREIIDPEKLHDILQRHQLITTDEFLKLCKVPVGETEKLLTPRVAKKAHLKVGAAKEAVAELIAPAISYNTRSPSLKPL